MDLLAGQPDSKRACVQGNRLAVPEGVRGAHFFYRTQAPAFEPGDVALLLEAVRGLVAQNGLYTAQVEVFSTNLVERHCPGAAQAMRRMSSLLPGAALHTDAADVVVCEWASIHVDDSFAGTAFLSVVLHTGKHDYVMQTVFTPTVDGLPDAKSSTRVLSAGDAFVFDPTTPHYAVPRYSSDDQLLVLLQVPLKDGDADERKALVEAVPPLDDDCDQHSVFSALG